MRSKDDLTTLTAKKLLEHVKSPPTAEIILGSVYTEALLDIRDILAEIAEGIRRLE